MSDEKKQNQARKIAKLIEQEARAVRLEIQTARKDRGLSQEEAASRMAWTVDVMGNIEKGRREISLPEFIVLARQMGSDPITMLKKMLIK